MASAAGQASRTLRRRGCANEAEGPTATFRKQFAKVQRKGRHLRPIGHLSRRGSTRWSTPPSSLNHLRRPPVRQSRPKWRQRGRRVGIRPTAARSARDQVREREVEAAGDRAGDHGAARRGAMCPTASTSTTTDGRHLRPCPRASATCRSRCRWNRTCGGRVLLADRSQMCSRKAVPQETQPFSFGGQRLGVTVEARPMTVHQRPDIDIAEPPEAGAHSLFKNCPSSVEFNSCASGCCATRARRSGFCNDQAWRALAGGAVGRRVPGLLAVLLDLKWRAAAGRLLACNPTRASPISKHILPEFLPGRVPHRIRYQDTYWWYRQDPRGQHLLLAVLAAARPSHRIAREGARRWCLAITARIPETFFMNLFHGGRLAAMQSFSTTRRRDGGAAA